MKVLIFIFSIVVISCNLSQSKNGSANVELTEQEAKDTLVLNWQTDSLGCKGVRNIKTIKEIFDMYELKKKSADEIKYFLGKPNEEFKNDKYHGLRYYTDNSCINDKLLPEMDRCWYEIIISNDRKEESGYAKVCQ